MIPEVVKKTSRNLFRSFRYPANLGQFSSPDYVTLAGGPHHPKCLATFIPIKLNYKEHFGIGFKSFGF